MATLKEEHCFNIGDVVACKKSIGNHQYPKMRVIQIISTKHILCEWYNKNWNEWVRTVFNTTEIVKK